VAGATHSSVVVRDKLPELSPGERRQKKERLRLSEPLQWTLAPRHSSKTRKKAGKSPAIDAGVSANECDSEDLISLRDRGAGGLLYRCNVKDVMFPLCAASRSVMGNGENDAQPRPHCRTNSRAANCPHRRLRSQGARPHEPPLCDRQL
jgi:hypothetical protein